MSPASVPEAPDLSGRVVLITGASSGIGEATARALARRGAHLVLGARRLERLQALEAELGGDHIVVRSLDVRSDDDVRGLIEAGTEAFGRLDAVFANAGFGGDTTVATGDPELWREMLMTNVYGAALTIRRAIDALSRSEQPHVILTSSVAGRLVPAGRNHMYSATKFAVEALGDGLRKEMVGRMKVTLVAPGAADTEFADWPGEVLSADDVARGVVYALEQPRHVSVNHILVRPLQQEM